MNKPKGVCRCYFDSGDQDVFYMTVWTRGYNPDYDVWSYERVPIESTGLDSWVSRRAEPHIGKDTLNQLYILATWRELPLRLRRQIVSDLD